MVEIVANFVKFSSYFKFWLVLILFVESSLFKRCGKGMRGGRNNFKIGYFAGGVHSISGSAKVLHLV